MLHCRGDILEFGFAHRIRFGGFMEPDATEPGAQTEQPAENSKTGAERLPWLAPAMERLDLREAMAGINVGAIEAASS